MDPTGRFERAFERSLLRLVGTPYKFGGRGTAGVDCSSLIMQGIRRTLRLSVRDLPWMTADQMAKGRRKLTLPVPDPEPDDRAVLGFFDWDQDGIYEHAAVRLVDGSWMWSSSTVSQVVRVDEAARKVWRRQWREIEGALYGPLSILRIINWTGWDPSYRPAPAHEVMDLDGRIGHMQPRVP